MNTRIHNVNILTMEKGKEIFCGEVWIRGDVIEYAGPQVSAEGRKWDQEIDGHGSLLMPGFKNAHTHSAMTFLRSHADDMKLEEWLNTRVFPAEAKLTDDDVYWLTKLAVLEYLTSGVTAVFDMYMHRQASAEAFRDMGFRAVFCESINDFSGTFEDAEKDYVKYNEDVNKMLSYRFGFHAEYTTGRENMEKLAALAHKYQESISVHCSETKKEVEDCRQRTGMTPVAYMDSLGLFDYGGTIFHGVHMDEADFDILKKRGMYVVTNPASNLKLASGVAPISKYLKAGIPVAIGTDGPASNNCLDMFREMFLVTGLQKFLCDDPQEVPASEVLNMACINGAYAMGLTECNILAKGKKADLILIDLNQPNMQPIQNIEKNLVYSGSKQNVIMTMVAGNVLYQNGEFFVDSSKEEIYVNANAIAKRILK